MSNAVDTAVTANTDVTAEILRGITDITKAFLANNSLTKEETIAFIRQVREELMTGVRNAGDVAQDDAGLAPKSRTEIQSASERWAHLPKEPAVPIEESVHQEYLVCLFDGCKKKMLKRYIRAKYGMEEKDYKEFWGLPSDYPMVAPGYSREKSLVAIAQGLGRMDKTPKKAKAKPQKKAA